MKLSLNNSISFMKTNDVHCHSGHWWCEATEKTPNAIKDKNGNYRVLKNLTCDVFELANTDLKDKENEVKKVIISNLDCMVKTTPDVEDKTKPFLKGELEGNIELVKNNKNKNLFFYATGQPGTGSAENLKQVIEKHPDKFIGIKLHPKQLDIPVSSPVYEPYMQLAEEKRLPVLFHSQINAVWKDAGNGIYKPEIIKDINKLDPSDPELIYNLAKKYPKTPVILGHAGAGAGNAGHLKTLDIILQSIKNNDAKLYCDISWVDFHNDLPVEQPKSIITFIKKLKEANALDRIMFGSDVPVGIFGEKQAVGNSSANPSNIYSDMQTKIKQAIRNDKELTKDADEIINKIFYQNAETLFNFGKKRVPKMKITALTIITALCGSGLVSYTVKKRNSTQQGQCKN